MNYIFFGDYNWLFISIYIALFAFFIINKLFFTRTKVPYKDVFPQMPSVPNQSAKNQDKEDQD